VSTYCPIPESEKFRIEYWELEEAKLRRRPRPKPLATRVALVTGGGSGIGRAVVARFVEEGARVGVLDRVAARADELRAEFGNAVVTSAGDVVRLADNQRAVAETVGAFGRLDIFVGNAGVFDVYAPLAEFPEEQLSEAFV